MSLKTSSRALRFADTGVYDNLHSNLPPSTMCFTEEPLPGILSEQTLSRYGEGAPFRHWSVIRQWVEDIFMKGGHRGLVEFNTTVEKAEKHGSTWVLTLRQETEGAEQDRWWQEEFDAVVVATGHYNVPYLPNIPGLVEVEEQFPGTVSHSKHYRSKADFQGKVGPVNLEELLLLISCSRKENNRSWWISICLRCPPRYSDRISRSGYCFSSRAPDSLWLDTIHTPRYRCEAANSKGRSRDTESSFRRRIE